MGNYIIDQIAVLFPRNQNLNALLPENFLVEVLLHRVSGAQQSHLSDALPVELPGRGFGDMQQRNGNVPLNLWGDLMHGVGADDEKIRSRPLQRLCCLGEDDSAFLPLSLSLAGFYFLKIHTVQQAFGRMKASQLLFDGFIDDLVIGDGAFPAHTADESNSFHG